MSNTQKNSQARMDIDVKIYRPSATGPVLADASVSLNGCFAIRDIQVRKGKNGYRDICFPCTAEFKQTFDRAVLGAYRMELERQQKPEQAEPAMDGMTM